MNQLGQLEAAVMDLIWERERPVLVRDVLEEMQRERDIAYTTVMTVMDNLHRKDFLARERDGRAYRYSAARSRAEHTAGLMKDVLTFTSDHSATLSHFVEHISAEDLAELRAALDKADTRKDASA